MLEGAPVVTGLQIKAAPQLEQVSAMWHRAPRPRRNASGAHCCVQFALAVLRGGGKRLKPKWRGFILFA